MKEKKETNKTEKSFVELTSSINCPFFLFFILFKKDSSSSCQLDWYPLGLIDCHFHMSRPVFDNTHTEIAEKTHVVSSAIHNTHFFCKEKEKKKSISTTTRSCTVVSVVFFFNDKILSSQMSLEGVRNLTRNFPATSSTITKPQNTNTDEHEGNPPCKKKKGWNRPCGAASVNNNRKIGSSIQSLNIGQTVV